VSCKPGVPKSCLHAMSGMTWSGVGLLLLRWVWVWLHPLGWVKSLPSLILGGAATGSIYLFFRRMAAKNIDRIEKLPQRPCLFAFQAWTSYPLVAVMISMGIALRSSSIPKLWLSCLYLGIGGALLLASLQYYRHLLVLNGAVKEAWPEDRR